MTVPEIYYTSRAGVYAAPIAHADALAGVGAEIIRRGRKWVYFRYSGDWERAICGLGLAVPIDLIFQGFTDILQQAIKA